MHTFQALSPGDLPGDLAVVLRAMLTWFQMLRACAAVLAVEALALAVLSFVRGPAGVLRVGAGVAFACAVGVGLLARDIWATYEALLTFSTTLYASFAQAEWYRQTINQTVPSDERAYWIALVTTGALLIGGLVLIVWAIRRGPVARRRMAGPGQGAGRGDGRGDALERLRLT